MEEREKKEYRVIVRDNNLNAFLQYSYKIELIDFISYLKIL